MEEMPHWAKVLMEDIKALRATPQTAQQPEAPEAPNPNEAPEPDPDAIDRLMDRIM